jgi:hypothetical protein
MQARNVGVERISYRSQIAHFQQVFRYGHAAAQIEKHA